jgi:hypothetical protein
MVRDIGAELAVGEVDVAVVPDMHRARQLRGRVRRPADRPARRQARPWRWQTRRGCRRGRRRRRPRPRWMPVPTGFQPTAAQPAVAGVGATSAPRPWFGRAQPPAGASARCSRQRSSGSVVCRMMPDSRSGMSSSRGRWITLSDGDLAAGVVPVAAARVDARRRQQATLVAAALGSPPRRAHRRAAHRGPSDRHHRRRHGIDRLA